MAEVKKCSKCNRELGELNKSGICTRCQKPARFGPDGKEKSKPDAKSCSKCSAPLRSSNTKGVCSNAAACRQRVGADVAEDEVLERLEKASVLTPATANPPKTKARSDAVKRFNVVAEAMGFDPDELLAAYCESWLAAVKAAAQRVEAGDESA